MNTPISDLISLCEEIEVLALNISTGLDHNDHLFFNPESAKSSLVELQEKVQQLQDPEHENIIDRLIKEVDENGTDRMETEAWLRSQQ